METLHMILALATQSYWELSHLNVKIVFLNEELQEKVYMIQLEGLVVVGQKSKVCHLKKALYGLRQTLCGYIFYAL
jgi:hypothetical protein